MKKLLLALSLTFITTIATAEPTFNLVEDTIVVEGVIGRQMSGLANQLLLVKQEEPGTIDIVINSPGGSVYAGWQFVNAMRIMQDRGYTLRCTVTSMAASMAYQILADCDERYAFTYSTLLWHPVRLQGMFTLTPKEALGLMKQLTRIERQLVTDLRAKFKVEDKEFWSHYHAETLHIGVQLQRMSPSFITIISDVGGLRSLSRLSRFPVNSKVKKVGPVQGVSPYKDAFIYMSREAYSIWKSTNN